MALTIEVVASGSFGPGVLEEILALCREAYAEDFSELLLALRPATHLLGRVHGELVAHALWVTRWLEPGGQRALRTAYVEAVATKPGHRGRGHASELMRRLAAEIRDYELGALSPAAEALYARLGWERWRGRLFIRGAAGLEPTPDEDVMILRLPRTPPDLDLGAELCAEWRKGELW